MKKTIACGLILLVLSSVFLVNTYSKEASLDLFVLESKVLSSNDLAKKLVRFHVIAYSDAEVDQEVKLKVKDDCFVILLRCFVRYNAKHAKTMVEMANKS